MLGTVLKELREEAKLSQNALSKKAGISQATLWAIENRDGCDPSWSTVCSLAIALNVSLGDLWNLEVAAEERATKKKK